LFQIDLSICKCVETVEAPFCTEFPLPTVAIPLPTVAEVIFGWVGVCADFCKALHNWAATFVKPDKLELEHENSR
jgi:hypothetical protein